MSGGGLLQGLGQLPTLSHQRGFPSAPTLSSYCHPRRLQRRGGAFTSRPQQEVAFNMEILSGVVRSSEFWSAFRGNAAYLDQRRPKYMSKEMAALLSIRRSGQLLVVQGLNQPFVQSHRPRGTFPAFGEEPTRTSSIALQDSAGPKLNGKLGGFVSDQNLGGDRVPDQLISSEGSSRTFPHETMWRNERDIHLPTSSSRASPPYRQLPSRVKYSASGEEAVLRGFENAAQQPSNKHRSSLPYGKIGSGIEPSYMIPDYARSSQNGAHPPPINEKSRLSSTKQVYNGSVLRHAPSDRLRGSTSNNRRMRDTDSIYSRIRKLDPDAQARCEDRPSELGAQKQQNTLTIQTVKAFNHSAQAGAVSAATKAGAAKWTAAKEELVASKSPPAAGEKASLSPLHVTVELELVGGSVQDSHENLDAHGEQHVEFSEAVGENTSQLDVVFKSEAAHDPARQGVHAAEEFQDISEISTSSHKGRHGLNAKVLVVNNVQTAEAVVTKLRGEYRGLIHACDTEVAGIDVKRESPVGHGRLICFSIYCGPNANFGEDRCRLWVDVLSEPAVLGVFKSYFEDADINKVWHNYSFDKHVLANHGINARGFYADTMHLARLYDSARSVVQGGYSLEGLTSDKDIMRGYWDMISEEESGGKLSMKQLFGKANVKKNGEEGKLRVVPPVEELQIKPESREMWIQYSSFDTVCTWCLWKSLRDKLINKDWMIEGQFKQEGKKMYNFYEEYLQPFGNLLVQMEAEGMMLDREHLARIEEIAVKQQEFSANQFKRWAAKRCPDAIYMNVGSDAQIRQLLFGGKENRNESKKKLEMERVFSAPNTEEYLEDGKKTPKKTRPFTLTSLGVDIPVDSYTSGGWPAVGGAALKALAGKVAIDYTMLDEMSAGDDPSMVEDTAVVTSTGVKGGSEEDLSVYGKAYDAFGGGQDGKEACMAFAALCEVSSINTLISNFIQPLQGSDIKGPDGRVHCSLNINTETGRLSARRPSLQNQPALEKDRYKIRQAFVAAPGNSLIVADYGQLELRILAHLTDCKSMLKAFEDGGDFHSRTAMNMYSHVRSAVEKGDVLLEWDPKPGELKPPVPLLKDVFAAERRKAKMLNFSIAYGKTAVGLSKDWTVSPAEAKATVDRWYSDRQEVLHWQEQRMKEARDTHHVYTLLGRTRHFPDVKHKSTLVRRHIERAAINTPVQGSAADVAMCAMLEISQNKRLQDLGWKLLLQVHDEVILEGPTESADTAKDEVVKCMSYPFKGKNTLRVALAVDAKSAQSWYAAK